LEVEGFIDKQLLRALRILRQEMVDMEHTEVVVTFLEERPQSVKVRCKFAEMTFGILIFLAFSR
jgi:hypothetical protein